ncbi:RND transporter, partial [Burkholderia cenocepacia]|nr:RND transporter [Burkholderia cenocepacia]
MDRSMTLKTKAARALALASIAAPLAGCAWFAPSGEPPAMPAPAHYGAAPQVQQTVSAHGVAQQFE